MLAEEYKRRKTSQTRYSSQIFRYIDSSDSVKRRIVAEKGMMELST